MRFSAKSLCPVLASYQKWSILIKVTKCMRTQCKQHRATPRSKAERSYKKQSWILGLKESALMARPRTKNNKFRSSPNLWIILQQGLKIWWMLTTILKGIGLKPEDKYLSTQETPLASAEASKAEVLAVVRLWVKTKICQGLKTPRVRPKIDSWRALIKYSSPIASNLNNQKLKVNNS